jgi:hypothetical protein
MGIVAVSFVQVTVRTMMTGHFKSRLRNHIKRGHLLTT